MPPIPPSHGDPNKPPRIILYHQTIYHNGQYVSMRNLVAAGATHIIIAALHLHPGEPSRIHLNDHPPDDAIFDVLWREKAELSAPSVLSNRPRPRFLCYLGGAAPGCFTLRTLDAPRHDDFMRYYITVRDFLRRYNFDGIDLGVEEPMTLNGIVRLVDHLHADFCSATAEHGDAGAQLQTKNNRFTITLSPVATALLGLRHLSGFDYFELERLRGEKIAWYNTQFYNNWGEVNLAQYILYLGWKPEKLVVGVLTNTANGTGKVPPFEAIEACFGRAREQAALFASTTGSSTNTDVRDRQQQQQPLVGLGGIMGWEYFNAHPGGTEKPWLWVETMARILGTKNCDIRSDVNVPLLTLPENLADFDGNRTEAPMPRSFSYESHSADDA